MGIIHGWPLGRQQIYSAITGIEKIKLMLNAYHKLGCIIWLKIRFHAQFSFLPENLNSVSEEHGKCFHQENTEIEKRRWKPAMLANCCWGLQRDTVTTDYKRKASC